MFAKLTDKILAPHRKEGETESNESSHHHHHHHHHEHKEGTTTPVVAPIVGAPVVGAPIVGAPIVAQTTTTTTTTNMATAPVLTKNTNVIVDNLNLPPTTQTVTMTKEEIDMLTAQGLVERQTIVKPAIVDEVVRKDTIVEVQPVVHREIEQPIINHIEQHVLEPKAAFVGGTVTNAPIVQENVNTRVVEEVQPIVHREMAVPVVQKVEEHLSERVVAPTQHTHNKVEIAGLEANLVHQKDAIVKPVIVDEKVRTDKIVEVQPIIHREVDRTIIRHVEQHIVEAPAPFVGGTVQNAAIIDEHVTARAVDEIQPIVHREIAVPKVEKVEEHLSERVVAPTQHANFVEEKAGLAANITHNKGAIVKPAIIDQKVREDIVVEVQPVVHREIDQKIVNHVEEHVLEPAAPFVGGQVQNKAIIDEKVHTKVIDEVQPVVHREVAVPVVEKREAHVQEHIVAPTQHTHDQRSLAGHVSDINVAKGAIIKPEIVDQTIRTDTIVEVQPIVHREIDQTKINHVEQHIIEPAAPNVGGKIVNAPKIEERIVTERIEEVQPVIHREIAVPVVEKIEQHLGQTVVAPTQHISERIEINEGVNNMKIDDSLSNFEKSKLLKKESTNKPAM